MADKKANAQVQEERFKRLIEEERSMFKQDSALRQEG